MIVGVEHFWSRLLGLRGREEEAEEAVRESRRGQVEVAHRVIATNAMVTMMPRESRDLFGEQFYQISPDLLFNRPDQEADRG